MAFHIPDLILLELRFQALLPIRNLPFYHGPQWSALFRHCLRNFLPAGASPATEGIWIHPVETGIAAYEAGEPIHLGLTFPAPHLPAVEALLRSFNALFVGEGHFQPGRTIRLEAVVCRVSGQTLSFSPEPSADGVEDGVAKWAPRPITPGNLAPEVEFLTGLDAFRIVFAAPLRLTRPSGYKSARHRYGDEDFFLDAPDMGKAAMDHLLKKIRLPDSLPMKASDLTIIAGGLLWVDVPYGSGVGKTIGGVMGTLRIAERPNRETAERLVLGQCVGAGKNPAFGLGFYTIPELDSVRSVRSLTRGSTLLERAVSPDRLKSALNSLKDSSPGPDGLTVSDLKKAGVPFLKTLSEAVLSGTHVPGNARKYRMPKTSDGYREIYVQNMADRLLQKAVSDVLALAIDRFLSDSSFAYRAGLNRQGAAAALRTFLNEGYTQGVKADITAFFDSVNLDILNDLLKGLFTGDPLTGVLKDWLDAARSRGVSGLSQGSPLSPVLSNLYLERFDRDMAAAGLKLVRYADDFAALFRENGTTENALRIIGASLAKLKLTLQRDKTISVRPGIPIKFLGYEITAAEIVEPEKPGEEDENGPWTPVFREEWQTGRPVYLTSICRGAFSSGAHLVVKNDRDGAEQIPWNRISRLVVVGRSPFSGGIVYRAVREDVPVTFIDVMGRTVGHLYSSGHDVVEMAPVQEMLAKDQVFCLAFARQIIAAKILNHHVLLRRNGISLPELKEMAQKVRTADSLDSLRGYEGAAARMYFGALAELVKPFDFKGRVYHPPDGPVNVMLSFGYTLLYNRLAAVLKEKGFNPRIGFFHKGRGGHLSLASDLQEELRHLAERVVLTLIHRGEIRETDFTTVTRKGVSFCRLEGEGFRKVIQYYERVMASSFTPEGDERMTYNAYLDEMADHLKRALKLGIPYRPLRID